MHDNCSGIIVVVFVIIAVIILACLITQHTTRARIELDRIVISKVSVIDDGVFRVLYGSITDCGVRNICCNIVVVYIF